METIGTLQDGYHATEFKKEWVLKNLKKVRENDMPYLFASQWALLERAGYVERVSKPYGFAYEITQSGLDVLRRLEQFA